MWCNQLIEITLPVLSLDEENQIVLPEITGAGQFGGQPKLQLGWRPLLQLADNLDLPSLCTCVYGKIPMCREYLESQCPEASEKCIYQTFFHVHKTLAVASCIDTKVLGCSSHLH